MNDRSTRARGAFALTRGRAQAHRRRKGERGYVMVMAALVLIPLLMMAGFAVDLGGNYSQAVRQQRASDAGALAGVVWLPDFPKAQAVALAIVAQNGYSSPTSTITVEQIGARRLKVTIVAPQGRYFTNAILNTNYTITRSSTAEYLRPIAMGSPIASLANDPESAAAPPQFWLNQSGPGSNKSNGDRNSSGLCVTSGSGFVSGCQNTAPSSTNPNLEISDGGYFYIARVDAVGSGDLRIQAFDPAFVYTGDNCTVNGWTTAQATTLKNQYNAIGDTLANSRYTFNNKAYCPGDQRINSKDDVRTTYIVRAPDNTPQNLEDNPAVCAISFDPYNSAGLGNNIFTKLDRTVPANLAPSGTQNMPFWTMFRRWVDVCTISSPVVGDYIVQVTTTADQSSPNFSTTGGLSPATGGAGSLENRDPTINTGGHNRLALRAGWGSAMSGTNLGLFGGGRLPIYVNQNSSSASFHLARLTPEYAAATLVLTFFDIADTAGTASMQVKPPPDSNYSTFPTCTFTRDGVTPNTISQTNCGISGLTSGSYDARTVTLKLQLPADYTCNDSSPTGCWVKVDLTFTGAPADTTTWAASLLGDPVRLVQ